jgi:2-polyprenyl-3-methyl-5-hydroxy-6-metoxy-1,4-benzoquinol methylase
LSLDVQVHYVMNICPICASHLEHFQEFYDDRYGYPGTFPMDKCTGCGHKVLMAHMASEMLSTLYSRYYPRAALEFIDLPPSVGEIGGISGWMAGERSSAFLWVPPNVTILDIGCGFGESLAYHAGRGCDVYGVEADENIRRVADAFGYKVQVGLFDANRYEPEIFDYVTMDQVVEHVTDPLETLCGIQKVLKQDGVLIISSPNANGWGAKVFGQRWINWHAPYHQQFFTIDSMRLAAEKSGLVLDKVMTITNAAWLHFQLLHLVTYPQAGEPSTFWSPLVKRSLKDRVLFKMLDTFHATKVNHLISRFFDILGIGDNYLFLLKKP